MGYFRRDELDAYADTAQRSDRMGPPKAEDLCPGVTAYVSHHRADHVAAAGLRALLMAQGVTVRTEAVPDGLDPTATDQCKQGIRDCTVFLLLVSHHSLQSLWLPWELGLAESLKPAMAIALVPLEEVTGTAACEALLRRYHTLRPDEHQAAVLFSPMGFVAELSDWLRGRQRDFGASASRLSTVQTAQREVHPFHQRGCGGL